MSFKIAFNTTPLHQFSIKESVDILQKYHYDAIELNASITPFGEPHIQPEMTEKEIESLIQQLSGMETSSISAHFELIHEDPEEEQKIIQYTKQSIDIAAKIGHPTVHGYSGNAPEGMADAEAWERIVKVVNEIVDYAEQKGVKYSFEPATRRFINNGETFGKLQKQVYSGKLYVNLDPANLLVAGDSLDTFFEKYGQDIIHVHMKDALINRNGQIIFPPIGEGKVDFERVLQLLKQVGYSGFLSIEYEADRFGYELSLDKILKTHHQYVHELIKKEK